MPLTLTVPNGSFFDEGRNRFFKVKGCELTLEHSLLSVSKWERELCIPFLTSKEKTREQTLHYIKCMTLTQSVNPLVYETLTDVDFLKISNYIQHPATATTIKAGPKENSDSVITAEIMYGWLVALQIPFDPCQKWHLNSMIMLVRVVDLNNKPKKKMAQRDLNELYRETNAKRRAEAAAKRGETV
jgi:hypothetical protein